MASVRFNGWVITHDSLSTEPADRIGYGQTAADLDRSGYNLQISTQLSRSGVIDPVLFRTLDDDGEVYYSGVISREWIDGDEDHAFAPLNFAQADAGATELQYRDNSTLPWQTL